MPVITPRQQYLNDVAVERSEPIPFPDSMAYVDIVFDGPPGPEAGRFVEVENPAGQSIRFGEWVKREDGYWVLRITPTQQ